MTLDAIVFLVSLLIAAVAALVTLRVQPLRPWPIRVFLWWYRSANVAALRRWTEATELPTRREQFLVCFFVYFCLLFSLGLLFLHRIP